jgi:hypothetical protein
MPPPDRYGCQEDFAGYECLVHAPVPVFCQIPQEIQENDAPCRQGSHLPGKPARRKLPDIHGVIFFTS